MRSSETYGVSGMTGKEHKFRDTTHWVFGGRMLGIVCSLSWDTPLSVREATGSQSPHSSYETP